MEVDSNLLVLLFSTWTTVTYCSIVCIVYLSKNPSEEAMFTILDTQPVEDENFEKFYWLPFVIDLLTCLNEQEDELFCKELLKAGITDSLNATFTAFLTGKRAMNVINASVVIFTFALIVIGFPFVYCIMVLFIPPIVLYIFLYATFLYEARDVGNKTFAIPRIDKSDNSSCFWIAEAYEDFSLHHCHQNQRYKFMTEEKFNESNINVSRHVRKIVGTIAFCNCNRLENSGWIKRLCVHKDYRRKGIGNYLVNQALKFGEEQGFERINVIISEYRVGAILLFINKGFNLHNIHSKQSLLSIAFYEYTYRTTHYYPRQ